MVLDYGVLVFWRLRRRYSSVRARFCADRKLRFRAIDPRKNELRPISRSRISIYDAIKLAPYILLQKICEKIGIFFVFLAPSAPI